MKSAISSTNIKSVVQESREISPRFISTMKYETVLVLDIFRLIEAEWLCSAIKSRSNHGKTPKLSAFSYEMNTVKDHTTLDVNRDAIINYVADKNIYHTVLTDENLSFAAHYNQHSDYFVYVGSPALFQVAYPVSTKTIKDQFSENLEIMSLREPIDKTHYERIWSMYSEHQTVS